MTSVRKQLIEEYLKRLDNASVFLTPQRRVELEQEIREHIEAAMDEVETLDATAVRTILERLGPPAEIVAAELGSTFTGSTPAVVPNPPPAAGEGKTQRPVPSTTRNGGSKLADTVPPVPSKVARPGVKMVLLGGAVATLILGVLTVGGYWLTTEPSQPPLPARPPAGTMPQATPTGSPATLTWGPTAPIPASTLTAP